MSKLRLKQLIDEAFGNRHCERILNYFLERKEIADAAWSIVERDNIVCDWTEQGATARNNAYFLGTSDTYHFYLAETLGEPFDGYCRLLHEETKSTVGNRYHPEGIRISCDEVYQVRIVNADKWAESMRRGREGTEKRRMAELEETEHKLRIRQLRKELRDEDDRES